MSNGKNTQADYRNLYEKEKAANERLLNQLFYENRTTMLLLTPDGDIVDANRSAEKFYGFRRDILKTKRLQDIDVFSSEKVTEALQQAVKQQEHHFYTRHQLSNGQVRDVELYSGVLDREDKRLLFVTVFDVTEKVKAQKELKRNLERYRKVFDVSPDVVAISRLSDGRYIEVNDRFEEVSGYSRKEVIGQTAFSLGLWVHPEDRQPFVEKVLKARAIYHYPVLFRRKNGEIFRAEVSANLMETNGELFLFSFTTDVEETLRTREALEQSELKFRKSFNISPFAIAITSLTTGRYAEVNEVFLLETGYKREEVVGKTAEELGIWVDYSQREGYLQKMMKEGYVKDFPINLRMKNGSEVHALVSSNIIELNGEPHLISITRSIEDYRQALSALREVELRYKTLFDLSPAGILLIDETGSILDANPSFCRLLAYQPQEIIGKKVWDALFPVADIHKEKVLKDIQEILKSGQPRQKEMVNYDHHGKPVYLRLFETVVDLENRGRIILSISLDFTREKEYRDTLARQTARLKEAQEIGRLGSWELVRKSKELNWSEGLYSILELPRSQKPNYDLFQARIHPDDLKEARYVLKESIKTGKPFKHIHRLLLDENRIKWVIERGKSFYDKKGNLVRIHGTVQDITRLKQTEDQLKELNELLEQKVKDRTQRLKKKQQDLSNLLNDMQQVQKKLEQSNRELQNLNHELEAFSYSVSHDLKAPVRAIQGFTTILKEDYYDLLDAEGQELIGDIVDETQRMAQIIDALLLLSRTGRKNLNYVEFNMEPLARSVFMEQQKHFGLKHARLEITELPVVFADYSLIKQLLSNLFSNALKYSSKRKQPVVEMGYEKNEKNGEVTLFIKDNGVGFSPDDTAKMFDAFIRLHSKTLFEGTGIGLAIAKRIVTRHGGKIWAESEPDQGAVFYFTLPSK